MLGKLEMELCTEPQEFMSYEKAVILQSILMSELDKEYAEILHTSQLHPYSQSMVNQNGKNIWSVCTTNEEAYVKMIEHLHSTKFTNFYIEKEKWAVTVKNKKLYQMPRNGLMEQYFFEDSPRIIEVSFATPTAFKSQGQYVFYPELMLIYQSLMSKYEASSEKEVVKSIEVLEQLVDNSIVMSYNLHSCYYWISKAKIPAFMGRVKIKINGPQLMVNFANLLFRFGEYSGVGIKTAMGMGKINMIERVKE